MIHSVRNYCFYLIQTVFITLKWLARKVSTSLTYQNHYHTYLKASNLVMSKKKTGHRILWIVNTRNFQKKSQSVKELPNKNFKKLLKKIFPKLFFKRFTNKLQRDYWRNSHRNSQINAQGKFRNYFRKDRWKNFNIFISEFKLDTNSSHLILLWKWVIEKKIKFSKRIMQN